MNPEAFFLYSVEDLMPFNLDLIFRCSAFKEWLWKTALTLLSSVAGILHLIQWHLAIWCTYFSFSL